MCQGSYFRFDLYFLHYHFQKSVFDIYTEITAYMPWINATIMSMGGMQACDIKLDVAEPKGFNLS